MVESRKPQVPWTLRCPGLLIAAGLSGKGFVLGPVVGKMLADLVTTGSGEHDPSVFQAEWFG